jgi:hypothetical protein
MAEGRIQILTHRTEDTVWQPRWLDHPNSAVALAGLVVASDDTKEAAERFGRFTNRPSRSSRRGQTIQLDRGCVELMSADAFRTMLPDIAIPRLPFMGAYGLIVRSLTQADAILRQGGLQPRRMGAALVVPFPTALGHGAWMLAEAAAELPCAR